MSEEQLKPKVKVTLLKYRQGETLPFETLVIKEENQHGNP